MAIIGILGYMMNTGFSALNMQVSPGEIQPRISPSDLAVETFNDTSQPSDDVGFFATFSNASYRENAAGNSVFNTILRNLFVTTANIPTSCNISQDYTNPYKETYAQYGFPSLAWQHRALSTALKPTASIVMAMNAAESELPSDDELPMNLSIATNLAVYALITSNSFLGWWTDEQEAYGRVNPCRQATNREEPVEMVKCLNLTSQSTTFLSDVHGVIVDYFSIAGNASTSSDKAKIEFSHFNLSDTVEFDALTIEIPGKMMVQPGSTTGNTYDTSSCNPGACLVMHDEAVLEYTAEGKQVPVYPRVQALAICLNDEGGEDLVVDFRYSRSNELFQSCKQRSNTSMIIVSMGKRVEGDAFEDHPEGSVGGRMVNARMVYSLTVGRLSWTVEDLADVYNATCTSDDDCHGIRFPLEQAKNSSTNDMLIVGNKSIPMNLLSPVNLNAPYFEVGSSKWKILASTLEETRGGNMESMPAIEPVIFPRNFKTINSTLATHMRFSESCDVIIDRHLASIEANHLYLEHTLQPAYTAGLYFIFQNAVVHNKLALNATAFPTKTTLAFSANIQNMHVLASIPTTSMFLAIAGCVVMVLGGVTIAVFGTLGGRALHHHSTAVTATEAIANQDKFPPFILRMKLRDAVTGKAVDVSLDSLRVENIVLVDEANDQHFVVGGNHLCILQEKETLDAARV
ncbi:hypothetical protein DVH05_015999 [Phytophthora capsici]|nr:hypothetical protein DVH05_015999 [Phytophthora capsici]